MLLEFRPHVFETCDCSLIEAMCLPSDVQEKRGKLDDIDPRLLATVPPIGVKHTLHQIWIKKLTETGDAADRDPYADGLAHKRHQLCASDLYGFGLARWTSPTSGNAANFLKLLR